jgi:hypothetical protein
MYLGTMIDVIIASIAYGGIRQNTGIIPMVLYFDRIYRIIRINPDSILSYNGSG